MKTKTISQGAEAIILQKEGFIIKKRIKKSYRLPQLDNRIRKTRTRREAKLIEKASTIIPVPKLIYSSEEQAILHLEFIKGKKLSQHLDKLRDKVKICRKMGSQIAKLHDSNIIHGDLTTSNMILSKDILYVIDFGLGFESSRIEDKAVDLHLIKEALEARHHAIFKKCFSAVLEGYRESKNASLVLQRFEIVESRGRYKESY